MSFLLQNHILCFNLHIDKTDPYSECFQFDTYFKYDFFIKSQRTLIQTDTCRIHVYMYTSCTSDFLKFEEHKYASFGLGSKTLAK